MHRATPMYYGVYMWAFDITIRLLTLVCNWGRLSSATVVLQHQIVKITIKKRWFNHLPGQYVFLWIPSVSFWETHPFTISSSTDKEYITFHVKSTGRWTTRLHKLAENRSKMWIGVQGAYGNTSIDINSSKYKRFILVSGGIGATPMLSIANSLCDQYRRGRLIDNIDVIWSVRDLSLVSDMVHVTEDNMFNTFKSTYEMENNTHSANLVSMNIYLTQSENDEKRTMTKNVSDITNMNVFKGRPNIKSLLTSIREECSSKYIGRVAVLACGPTQLMNTVSKLTRKLSNRSVRFDFHCETFDL